MTTSVHNLPDAESLLNTLTSKLAAYIRPDTAIVGIHSGGAWIAEKITPLLRQSNPESELTLGVLDSSFYRDDYNQRGLHAETRPSQIPFDVQDKHILLIDDVFYTGRTIRAAMNELFDYGRPASITLAVLINRGGRELPICPQVTALELEVPHHQKLQLSRDADNRLHFTLEENA
ncbi:bifunctional pyr operon transcriptional regulator/uracil phosphoribosyltransferase PyrR [Methylobacillus caricis]|uniref:bifunctional pyr operon transcriptional regulator/uracil phosphoribosyltransferase PyrR n=1 Tax=Methylobacillus caricis TaxID=1971611 RepID=UPI001CFFB77D|nr:bifunctional pyr operon transcriptional regulator/uracil phosphoribosyltransferase PyrR [Methylobacillus caricis]MCB5188426.1 bifunctional pyr operon transcriptional regulator/uracil phosphoribosyltransferase PyrR [Methylobacillus caricis]